MTSELKPLQTQSTQLSNENSMIPHELPNFSLEGVPDSLSSMAEKDDLSFIVQVRDFIKWLILSFYDLLFMCFPSSYLSEEEKDQEQIATKIIPQLISKWQPEKCIFKGDEDPSTLKAWFDIIAKENVSSFHTILEAFFGKGKVPKGLSVDQFVDDYVTKLKVSKELILPVELRLPYSLNRFDMKNDLRILSIPLRNKIAQRLNYSADVTEILEQDDPFVEFCFCRRQFFCTQLEDLRLEILEN